MSAPKKKGVSQWVAMEYVWEVLVAVALPPTVFALVGRWLDERLHHTRHPFTIVGFFLSLFVVFRLVLVKGRRLKQLYKENASPPTPDSSSQT